MSNLAVVYGVPISACCPLCCKICAVCPVLMRVAGELGAADPRICSKGPSGPLNRLNAILSLLHPLDRDRNPSAIGTAIGRPYLALSRIKIKVGVLNRLVLNRLENSTAR